MSAQQPRPAQPASQPPPDPLAALVADMRAYRANLRRTGKLTQAMAADYCLELARKHARPPAD